MTSDELKALQKPLKAQYRESRVRSQDAERVRAG